MRKLIKKGLKCIGISVAAEVIILFGVYGYATKVSAHPLSFDSIPQAVIEATFVEADASANDIPVIEETSQAVEEETPAVSTENETEVSQIKYPHKTLPTETKDIAVNNSTEETSPVEDSGIGSGNQTATGASESATSATQATTATTQTTAATTQAATQATTQAATEATTQAPTEAPTQPPTEAPTQPPTEAPTQPPTEAPTQPPTEAVVPLAQPAVVYTNVTYKNAYATYTFATLEEAKASISVPTLSDAEGNARAVSNKTTYSSQASRVLQLINEYRSANGLGTVAYDDTIATAAMHRAAESAYSDWNMTAYENGVTKRHLRPNFEKASTILGYYGLGGSYGENYGRYQESPEEILDGWKNSSSHNAVLLTGAYTRCGIGVAQDSEGYFYWIALFM